jgi:hypothetical protein
VRDESLDMRLIDRTLFRVLSCDFVDRFFCSVTAIHEMTRKNTNCNSWIASGYRKTIHEITRKNTNQDAAHHPLSRDTDLQRYSL